MNTPKDKLPTQESLQSAQRFAASLLALPQPKEKHSTDYKRGFEEGYQAALRNAQEMITEILRK